MSFSIDCIFVQKTAILIKLKTLSNILPSILSPQGVTDERAFIVEYYGKDEFIVVLFLSLKL